MFVFVLVLTDSVTYFEFQLFASYLLL